MSDADDEELPDLTPKLETEPEKFSNFPRKKRRNQYRGRPFILTEDADDEVMRKKSISKLHSTLDFCSNICSLFNSEGEIMCTAMRSLPKCR